MFRILGYGWRAVAALRARLYERGWLQRHSLDRPVISVGALSVGGAGKTPTTAAIAALLLDAGYRPAILSRGYKRRGSAPLLVSRGDGAGPTVTVREAGDEPFWLASVLRQVPVAVAARREEAAEIVLDSAPVDVFLLDDGFQHVRIQRDVDLVVVRPDSPFWEDRPLPAGRLRESPAAADRASAFLIVGDAASGTGEVLDRRFPGKPRFAFRPQTPGTWPARQDPPEATVAVQAATDPAQEIGGPAYAFAGIAHPERFFHDLEESGVSVTGSRRFADHHAYSKSDIAELGAAAQRSGAQVLITTEKDAVRLPDELPDLPVLVWGYRLSATDSHGLLAWLEGQTGLERRAHD